jgi:hypothetical protein
MKSQPYQAKKQNNLSVKGKAEATMKSSRALQQRPRGKVPNPNQYSSTENSLTSSSLDYEKDYGQMTQEQIHNLVKKKTKSTKDIKSNKDEFGIFNSSDSEQSQEEQKFMKIRNSKLGHLTNNTNKFAHDDTEDSIKSNDSILVSTDEMFCKKEGNQPGRISELRSYSEYLDAYDQNQNSIEPRKSTKQTEMVGFGLLPAQVYSKAIRRGFEFCLMVAGASGLGKSTLVNSMFLTDIYTLGGASTLRIK